MVLIVGGAEEPNKADNISNDDDFSETGGISEEPDF